MTPFFVRELASLCPETRPRLPVTRIFVLLLATCLLAGCNLASPAAASDPAATNGSAHTSSSAVLPTDTPTSELPPLQESGDDGNESEDAAGPYVGEVEPVDEIAIVTEVGGRVLEMNVSEGDGVSAGQTLLRLDSTTLEAERAHALASLQAAQAQVEVLQLPASEAEIEAARAQVAVAEAAYQRALNGPSEEELSDAETQLFQAEAALRRAQAAYDQLKWNPLIASMPESAALQEAKADFEEAQARYDTLLEGASEEEIAQAYATLATARAHLQRLEDGPAPAEIEAAAAQVEQAETALYLAQLQLEKATVVAPVDGIVAHTFVSVGSTTTPGATALLLHSPTVKVVIAVDERNISQVELGQAATIEVEAYPGQSFAATVSAIAPQVEASTRTVSVTVKPTDTNPPLLPGMSATVEIAQE